MYKILYFQSTKPIMEKRRRARINACLAELKSLLMDVIKAEVTAHRLIVRFKVLISTLYLVYTSQVTLMIYMFNIHQ